MNGRRCRRTLFWRSVSIGEMEMKFGRAFVAALLASGLLAVSLPAAASAEADGAVAVERSGETIEKAEGAAFGHASGPRNDPAAKASDADTVLVVCATGRSGPAVLAALEQEGYTRIRALVRDVDRARRLLGDDIELVQADVRNAESLDSAMVNVRYIVSALGSNTFNDPANSPELIDYEGVRNLAEAARRAGVAQFVQVSSLGISRAAEHPLNRFGRVMEWKAKGEEALRSSGVTYTIVRAGGLLDTPGGEAGIQALQGDKLATGQIPRADVAMVCVKALRDPAARGKTLEVVSGNRGETVNWADFFAGLQPDA
jgi:uncharacterized protein YbjT (DUF2867 family)